MIRRDIEIRALCNLLKDTSKFKGQPPWVVYYWNAYIASHSYEEDESNVVTYRVTKRDLRAFPELEKVSTITIVEDDQGKVREVYRRSR